MNSDDRIAGWRWVLVRSLWLITQTAAVILVVVSVVTLFARHHWLPDLLANLRMQQCLALLAVLVIFVACRSWIWLAATLVCLAVHIPWFLPDSARHVESGSNAHHLTITLANVFTHNQNHDQIIADLLSRDPDVIVILELSTSFAARLGSQFKTDYPHSIVRPMDDGNFGIGLYSRHPIDTHEVFTLNTEIKSISVNVRIDGNAYRIFASHPFPPIGDQGYRLRNEHLRQLAARIQDTTSDTSTPCILVGDLNLTPWSPHFQRLQRESGLLRASDGFNVAPTWYRYPAFPFGLVLDHAMVSEELRCIAHVVGPDIGSDHRSVTVTLAPALEASLER